MRNFLKLISITTALLLVGTSNQIYSSEKRQIDIKSNTLISNAIEEKKIKTVTANGFGTAVVAGTEVAVAGRSGNQTSIADNVWTKLAYNTDVDEVRSILNEIALKNEDVLKNPKPRVRFREFADSGLRLQLLFWIHKPEIRGKTVDLINTEIYKTFNEKNILIPFPTMNVVMPKDK